MITSCGVFYACSSSSPRSFPVHYGAGQDFGWELPWSALFIPNENARNEPRIPLHGPLLLRRRYPRTGVSRFPALSLRDTSVVSGRSVAVRYRFPASENLL